MTVDECYLYVLFDPRTIAARYVGITKNPQSRLQSHIRQAGRVHTHKNHWINELVNLGESPVMMPVSSGSRECMKHSERLLIANLREAGFPLTNATDGGDGVSGLTWTDEGRRKISKALRKDIGPVKLNNRTLTRHTEASVEKIRLANSGEANHQAKLTRQSVDRMRLMMEDGFTNKEVAMRFGVSITQATRIRRYESWK